MRVLMISDVYFPRVNGVSTSIRTFRSVLAQQGVSSTLVVPDYPQHDSSSDAADQVVRVPGRYLPFDPEDRLMRKRELRRRLRELNPESYDLIHVQTPFAAHYAGVALARRYQKPVLTTYHTLFAEYIHCYAPWLPSGLGRNLAQMLSRRQCNAVDLVIAPSRIMHDTLRGYGINSRIEVVPTGLPLGHFAQGNGPAFRQQHGISANRPMALYVGRVAHEKNLPLLLEMMQLLRTRQPDLLLVIAGEGPALPGLQRQVEKLGLQQQVRFIGYLDRQTALIDCYHAADVFVFPSVTETQGLVLLEAMACGVPVVAVAAMGAAEIVLSGKGALPVAASASAFADGVASLMSQPEKRASMATAARNWADQWSDQATAARLRDCYESLLVQDMQQTNRTIKPQAVLKKI